MRLSRFSPEDQVSMLFGGLPSLAKVAPEFPAELAQRVFMPMSERSPRMFDARYREKTLLGYLMPGDRSSHAGTPVLLSDALLAWLTTEVRSPRFHEPMPRLLTIIARSLPTFASTFQTDTPEGLVRFAVAAILDVAPSMGFPGELLPDSLFALTSQPLPIAHEAGPLPPTPLSQGLWRRLAGKAPPILAEEQRLVLFSTLRQIATGGYDHRVLPEATRVDLVTPIAEGAPVTGLMAEALVAWGLAAPEEARDPVLGDALATKFFLRLFPRMELPPILIEAHASLADRLGFPCKPPDPPEPQAAKRQFLLERDFRRRVTSIPPLSAGTVERPKVAVIGAVDIENGLGVSARSLVDGLLAANVEVQILNRYAGGLFNKREIKNAELHVAEPDAALNIIHFNGQTMLPNLLSAGMHHVLGRRNVAVVYQEMSCLDECTRVGLDLMDEVWCTADYQVKVLTEAGIPIVRKVGLTVQPPPPPPGMGKGWFGVPEDAFLVVFTMDAHSTFSRKNPIAALRAFQAAFPPGDDGVRLIIKLQNAQYKRTNRELALWMELREAARRDPRISLINEGWTHGEALALIACSDLYLSLHRAEGFGLGMTEAMALGVPVVATAWSGSADFIMPETAMPVPHTLVPVGEGNYYAWTEGQVWAEANIEAAAAHLRTLRADPAHARRIAEAGRAFVAERYSLEDTARSLRLAVEAAMNGTENQGR